MPGHRLCQGRGVSGHVTAVCRNFQTKCLSEPVLEYNGVLQNLRWAFGTAGARCNAREPVESHGIARRGRAWWRNFPPDRGRAFPCTAGTSMWTWMRSSQGPPICPG